MPSAERTSHSMTTRNLDALFEPKSIALIGASNQPRSVGAVTAKNLFEAGFAGPIMTVNPHEQAIRSTINYHSVEELPLAPDLAVIATPPPTVPEIVASLGARGTRAVIVFTAGFGEGGSAEGAELRRRTLEAAKPHLVRILGPNCLGFISPARGINASFAHLTPLTGGLDPTFFDPKKPLRRRPAAHRRTATAAGHVNSMRRSVSRVRQNPQEKCVLIAKSSALSTFDLASACLGAVRRRAGGNQADGSGLARNGRRLGLNRQQSGGCRLPTAWAAGAQFVPSPKPTSVGIFRPCRRSRARSNLVRLST